MSYTNFRFEVGQDGIAVATWDMPGRSMNVIDEAVMSELADIVETVASDQAVKGCVVASGKDAFSGGADLGMLEKLLGVFQEEVQRTGREAAVKRLFEEAQRLSRLYRRETYDNYPAARAILSCVYEGLQVPIDAGLRIEARYFTHILQGREAPAMIRTLFISMQELNKLARRPEAVPPTRFGKIGVLGAGFMGAGIAYVTAAAGIDVVLVDRDQESAERGKALSHKLVTERIMKGRASTAEREALLSRITPTADYAALAGCDLVIEAVFED
ncbi:MAG: 3-hydroxyacyl-CoA dehydrogenase NAD-binding domain-containing protein, partial [Pseudomonadota bacterium]|nr:3-hydroxyacyl-CoA dehydrogenase NAD-binding domain-containing protein [Pseudomonadota bacterium]